jgi:hypothetical protein
VAKLRPRYKNHRRKNDAFSLRLCLLTALLTIGCGLLIWWLFKLLTGGTAIAGIMGEGQPSSFADPRVVVVKHERKLYLFDGHRPLKTYDIALGQPAVRDWLHPNTETTPEGIFYICNRNPGSRYHRFLGISYPDETAVQRGLTEGLISQGQAQSIREALRQGRQPDWFTALGGGFGLHGGGIDRDWTAGCVALTNRDIEELDSILAVGDRVEILP